MESFRSVKQINKDRTKEQREQTVQKKVIFKSLSIWMARKWSSKTNTWLLLLADLAYGVPGPAPDFIFRPNWRPQDPEK